jgi:hypothetical protein
MMIMMVIVMMEIDKYKRAHPTATHQWIRQSQASHRPWTTHLTVPILSIDCINLPKHSKYPSNLVKTENYWIMGSFYRPILSFNKCHRSTLQWSCWNFLQHSHLSEKLGQGSRGVLLDASGQGLAGARGTGDDGAILITMATWLLVDLPPSINGWYGWFMVENTMKIWMMTGKYWLVVAANPSEKWWSE